MKINHFIIVGLFLMFLVTSLVYADGRVINIQSTINEFLDLDDTPSAYTGADELCVIVNETGGSLYFGSCSNATGAGDITSVTAGHLLSGGGSSGAVTLNVDSASLNQTISTLGVAVGFNSSSGSGSSYNATYEAFNSTGNVQGLLNLTDIYSTYNSTYHIFAYNMTGSASANDYNHTQVLEDLYKIYWYNMSDGSGSGSSYNVTYAIYAYNETAILLTDYGNLWYNYS